MTSKADADWHRTMAAHLFNSTWTLIEKKRRTKEERDTMIHMAHASRDHWGVVCGPKGPAVGEGQMSHAIPSPPGRFRPAAERLARPGRGSRTPRLRRTDGCRGFLEVGASPL